MPTYTFFCLRCDKDSEVLCNMAERDKQNCSTCGMPLERKIDRPAWVWHPTSTRA